MTEQWLPKDKAELMSAIEREWNALLRVVEQLPAGKISAPDAGGWSPKDNLAHLTEWTKILLGYHLDKRPSHEVLGVPEEITNKWDFDNINQLLLERNKERGWDDVLNELKQVYAQAHQRITSLDFDADLMKPYSAEEQPPMLSWVIGYTVEHFAEHRQTIEKLL